MSISRIERGSSPPEGVVVYQEVHKRDDGSRFVVSSEDEGGKTFIITGDSSLPEGVVVWQESERDYLPLIASCKHNPTQCSRRTKFVDDYELALHGYTCGGVALSRFNPKTGTVGQAGMSIHCKDQSA